MSSNKPKKSLGLESLGSLLLGTHSEPLNIDNEEIQENQIAPSNLDLRVSLDKKQRNGKAVTLVTGFGDLHADDLYELGRMLKSKCGVGGSTKDGEIIVQGDHVAKVMEVLKQEGFRVKRTGG